MPLAEPLRTGAQEHFTRQVGIGSRFAFGRSHLQALVYLLPQTFGTPQQLAVEGRTGRVGVWGLTRPGAVGLRRGDLARRFEFAEAQDRVSHDLRVPHVQWWATRSSPLRSHSEHGGTRSVEGGTATRVTALAEW